MLRRPWLWSSVHLRGIRMQATFFMLYIAGYRLNFIHRPAFPEPHLRQTWECLCWKSSKKQAGKFNINPCLVKSLQKGKKKKKKKTVGILKTTFYVKKFSCLKYIIQQFFSQFTKWCKRHHVLILEHFHDPNGIFHVHLQLIPHPCPRQPLIYFLSL